MVPKALTSAFGIDGEKGLKVVENIVAFRRALAKVSQPL